MAFLMFVVSLSREEDICIACTQGNILIYEKALIIIKEIIQVMPGPKIGVGLTDFMEL